MSQIEIRTNAQKHHDGLQGVSECSTQHPTKIQSRESEDDHREDEWEELNYDQYNYGIYMGWI